MDASNYRILVVDDEPQIGRNIEKMLAKSGFSVKIFSDVEKAFKALSEYSFDLVLLDIVMPDWTGKLSNRSGVGLLKQIRDYNSEIPIVMLTASTTVDLAVECMKNGASDYILKGSISGRDFVEKIKTIIGVEKNELNSTVIGMPDSLTQSVRSDGIKKWITDRGHGILDELIAGIILTGILYGLGIFLGVLDWTPGEWLSKSTSTLYIGGSILVILVVIVSYILWQRKYN